MPAGAAEFDPALGEAAEELASSGLILRGGFNFSDGEPAPAMEGGAPAAAVALVGAAGAGYWPYFAAWRAAQPAEPAHPLDAWSREVIGRAARRAGAVAVAPSDRPYQPFQQWAMRAEGLRPSPLGILIHPRYGLWHAYRGALLLGRPIAWRAAEPTVHPCAACHQKPCLRACPVEAHQPDGFAHAACLAYVRGPLGSRCRTDGCFSRNACPVGEAFRYPPAVQAFHTAAFAGTAGG